MPKRQETNPVLIEIDRRRAKQRSIESDRRAELLRTRLLTECGFEAQPTPKGDFAPRTDPNGRFDSPVGYAKHFGDHSNVLFVFQPEPNVIQQQIDAIRRRIAEMDS
jgi:hypothetical protein